jgi:hypothetical protein
LRDASETLTASVDVVAVDFRRLLNTLSHACLCSLVVDYIHIDDEVVDKFRIGEHVPNECTGAVVCRGSLACRFDIVFFDAEVVVWNKLIQNCNVMTTGHELFGDMAADESGTAGGECTHRVDSLWPDKKRLL